MNVNSMYISEGEYKWILIERKHLQNNTHKES